MFGGESVCNAEDGRSRLCGEHRAEALAIFQSAGDISSAVKVKHGALGGPAVRGDECGHEIAEVYVLFGDVGVIGAEHKLAHFILRGACYADGT